MSKLNMSEFKELFSEWSSKSLEKVLLNEISIKKLSNKHCLRSRKYFDKLKRKFTL